jgi:hypothetical protein
MKADANKVIFAYQTDPRRILKSDTAPNQILASKKEKVTLLDGTEKKLTVFFVTTPEGLEKLGKESDATIHSVRQTVGKFKELMRERGNSYSAISDGLKMIHKHNLSEENQKNMDAFRAEVDGKKLRKKEAPQPKELKRSLSMKDVKEKTVILNKKAQDTLDLISDNISIPIDIFETSAAKAIKAGLMIRVDENGNLYNFTNKKTSDTNPPPSLSTRIVQGTVTQTQTLPAMPIASATSTNKPLPTPPKKTAKPLPTPPQQKTSSGKTASVASTPSAPNTFSQPINSSKHSASDIVLPDLPDLPD